MSLFRNICFTINNWTENDRDLLVTKGWYSYLVFGYEVGANGTPHIQGYAELSHRMRLKTLQKHVPRAHIEARRGSAKEAADYCKKDHDFEEYGEMSQQGSRHDLDSVRVTASDSGMRGVTAVYNHQQIMVAEKFLTYNEDEREWKPYVVWFHGPTGTGKSKRAREMLGDDVYTKNTASKWWNGYDRHEDVIIDDFRDSWWDLTYMLALLDRYGFRVETKGGMRQMLARRIVVTSALHPKDCYRGTGEAIQQLLRRVDDIVECVPLVPEVAKGNNEALATDGAAALEAGEVAPVILDI